MKKLFLLLLMVASITLGAAAQQTRTVSGTVTYAGDGEPLAGATVMPIGGGQGAATNIDGEFTLKVPASVKKLRVSYIGMHTQEVAITGDKINVALTNMDNRLDEVMVVAYGTAKKSAYTGSASVVNAEELEDAMVTNALNSLSGSVSGVQILNTNGQPGASPTVRIRGVGSINASSTPLYVLDGMPFDGDIATLNTMDIESMTVLKDAAAAALYGARGANGVILITTKKGKEGEARVTFDARWGANSRQVSDYDVIESPAQYYEMAYTALYNGALTTNTPAAAHRKANEDLKSAFGQGYQIWTVPAGQSLVGTNGKLNPNATLGYSNGSNYYIPDDWADGTYRNGLRQEYNLSISGGSDRFNYYVSGGYLKDEGVIIGSDYERISTRVSMDYQAKKWLKIGTNMSYNHVSSGWPDAQTTVNSGSNAFLMANLLAPIYPMYIRDANGIIMQDSSTGRPIYDYGDGLYASGQRNIYNRNNAVSDLIYGEREYLMDVMNGKWYATITPVTNLNITGTIGYFLDNTRLHERSSSLYGQSASYGGINETTSNHTHALNLQALATYRHTIADKHNLDYLLGYESYELYMESLLARGYNLYNPDNWTINNTLNNENRKGYGNADEYSTRGIFGRVNYDYDGRYYFSASYRRDASSRFAPDKRWGNFFSVSAAWDVAKESFMDNQRDWLDMFKVKFSFGQQGNDGIIDPYGYQNYHPYLDQYQLSGTDSWSDGTLYIKGNPDITWETSNALNAGIDFSFWKGKLDGTVEYFQRQTSDMLYNKPVAPSNGYSEIPMNVGSMRNYGIEFELNYRPIQTRNITWEINANGTWLRNKIIELSPDLNGELISGVTILREGDSMYQYYMVKYAGVNPENGNPMYWTKDADGNEVKTENYDDANQNNRCATGNTLPTFYGGFGTTIKAYGFDFGIQFGYQLGGKVLDYTYANLMHSGDASSMGFNWHKDMLNAWTPENTNTNIPKLNSQATYNLYDNMTDFYLISSNYLSLNNITLGYTIPASITERIGIESIRIYCAGDNLALWSKRKGLDPRKGYSGIYSGSTYSAIRNISGGIRVVF